MVDNDEEMISQVMFLNPKTNRMEYFVNSLLHIEMPLSIVVSRDVRQRESDMREM